MFSRVVRRTQLRRSGKIGAMTQIPAGWYPDPDPNQPVSAPGQKRQRYWDGQQWTEHVQPGVGQPAAPGGTLGGTQGGYDQGTATQDYQPMAPYAGGVQIARATTPDGQPLAGWWIRVAAFLIDTVIVSVVGALLGFTWVRQITEAYTDFIDQTRDAVRAGSAMPDTTDLMADIAGPLLAFSLLSLAVSFAYHAGFLKWKAATPGKLALGLRVRLRETPGPLSWATVVKRWVTQKGYAILTVVPILGSVIIIYPLLNGLWPLWDSRKQALHDKVAKTNVVRQRGAV
jgi:uncharacterized RDD family membrane protein YckC